MIKHVIFDLGGVIINLNQRLTIQAFKKFGINLSEISEKTNILTDYETGKQSDDSFRNAIRTFAGVNISDKDFDDAWNAMLLDIPFQRLKILAQFAKHYNLFLLSNTNNLHIQAINRYMQANYPTIQFENLFQQVYYSHQIGLRKPDRECFLHVLESNNLNPQHTLFIDDSEENIKGAEALGIKTIHALLPVDENMLDAVNSYQ